MCDGYNSNIFFSSCCQVTKSVITKDCLNRPGFHLEGAILMKTASIMMSLKREGKTQLVNRLILYSRHQPDGSKIAVQTPEMMPCATVASEKELVCGK